LFLSGKAKLLAGAHKAAQLPQIIGNIEVIVTKFNKYGDY